MGNTSLVLNMVYRHDQEKEKTQFTNKTRAHAHKPARTHIPHAHPHPRTCIPHTQTVIFYPPLEQLSWSHFSTSVSQSCPVKPALQKHWKPLTRSWQAPFRHEPLAQSLMLVIHSRSVNPGTQLRRPRKIQTKQKKTRKMLHKFRFKVLPMAN